MKITITIDCDNAAFSDGSGMEAGKILHNLAVKLEENFYLETQTVKLRDSNGNTIGKCEVED